MAPRVLLLTQWFEPEPAFKGLLFARELQRQGFEVEVLTAFPNYPGGKLYDGYRVRPWQREVMDGVPVLRVALYPSHDRSALRRVANYVSFAASSLAAGLVIERPDVIYAYHPPLTVGISAAVIRALRGVPVVLDIQDLWPDTLRATGMLDHERALRLVGWVCDRVYAHVDRVVVLSPGFARRLVGRVPEDRVEVIYNWADEAALTTPRGTLPEAFPGPERFRVVFAGNMGKAQALGAVLDAAALLQARAAPIDFVFIGGGLEVDALKTRAQALALTNTTFLPPVPMAEIGTVLQAADALLVHLRRDPLFEITIPSKTQAYMTIGKPLLMAVDGDAADLVRLSGSGLVATSEDAASIAEAAERLAAMAPAERAAMGARARAFYDERLSLRRGAERFGAILRRLADGPQSAAQPAHVSM